ncbi:hypothetical protein YJ58_01100 [Salmonella enterica subsp. enterica serovar Enteritidis]|nr:hypothetical protein [Salmonella enterica subsp. enterica serovar Enteritidis]EED7075032.1 hypothetical protein [Salmonella enterica subsp. enterica serovar Enteritidis]
MFGLFQEKKQLRRQLEILELELSLSKTELEISKEAWKRNLDESFEERRKLTRLLSEEQSKNRKLEDELRDARRDAVYQMHDVVGLINQYYGLSLKPADVVNTEIDRKTWRVDLVATPTSLGWIGQQQVQLLPGDALLPANFEPLTVTPYEYPYFNIKVGQGAVYSYPWRFDNFAEEFQRLGAAITTERLAQILKTVTGDNWTTYRNPIDFNLREAVVVYNGRNKAELPTNPAVDNVLIVELSLYCLNFGGRLYLHYNDPD